MQAFSTYLLLYDLSITSMILAVLKFFQQGNNFSYDILQCYLRLFQISQYFCITKIGIEGSMRSRTGPSHFRVANTFRTASTLFNLT